MRTAADNQHPTAQVLITWLAAALCLTTSPLHAQTWDGGGANNNWTTVNNWNPDAVPANDGTANVIFAGTVRLTVNVDFARNVNSITFNNTAGAFTLAGSGITIQGGGVTNDDADTQTINSAITLGASQTWNANAGDLVFGGNITNGGANTAKTLTVTGASNTTLSAVVSNGAMARTLALTKNGAGTLTLGGANTFTGTITINAGTLRSTNATGLSTAPVTLAGGTLQISNVDQTYNQTFTVSSASTIRVDDSRSFTLGDGANDLTGAGNLTKTGGGTLILPQASNWTGVLTISEGVVNVRNNTALGTSTTGNTIASGAALEIQNNISMTEGSFLINGTGVSGNGAIRNISGTNTLTATLDLNSNARVQSDSGSLTLAGNIDLAGGENLQIGGAGNTTLSGQIFGSGSLTKDGTGTATISGSSGNTYSGTTTVNAGTLVLSKSSGNASQGSWIIGDGTGTDTLRLGASQQIQDSSSIDVTINSSGVFDLNGFNETLSQITLVGGSVTTGTGTLTIGNLGGYGIASNASATGATISGNLALAPFSTTINVADGSAANDLTISAAISGNRIVKEGAGVLVLSGTNTFTDSDATGFNPALTINAGTVSVSAVANLGNSANDIWLNGGTLRVTGNINSAANQRYYVNSGGGTFEVTSGNTLTWDDAAQLRTSGSSGTLTKSGAGTLLISANNTTDPFAGPVVVEAGTLRLNLTNQAILLGPTSDGNSGQPTFGRPLGNSANITVNNGGTFVAETFGSDMASSQRVIQLASTTITVNDGGTMNMTTSRQDIEFYGTTTATGASASVNLNTEDDIKFNGDFTLTNGAQLTGIAPDGVLVGNDGSGNLTILNGADAFFTMGGATKTERRFTVFNGGTLEVSGSGSTFNLGNVASFTGLSLDVNSGGVLRLADSGTANINDQILARFFNGSTFDGGSPSTKGTLILTGDLQARSPTVTNTPNVTMTTSTTSTIAQTATGTGTGGLTGLGTFTKTGTGTTTIASTVGTNNFGAQTIDVNQGTLLFGASNRVADSSNFRLSGGTLATGGFSDTVGTLTLTANSTIDMGAGASILNFSNSSSTTWTTGATLSITNWSGIPNTGGGTDQIFFGTTSSGLTSAQLDQIFFINPASLPAGTYAAKILASGEVVPVPEPGIWAALALLASWITFREIKRRRPGLLLS